MDEQKRLLLADRIQEAVSLHLPPTWANKHNRALGLEMLEKYADSLKEYEAAISLTTCFTEKARSTIGTANCHRHTGKSAENLACLLEAKKIDPKWPQTYFLLSAHYVAVNDLEQAVDNLYLGYGRCMDVDAIDTLNFCHAYLADIGARPATLRNGAASLLDQLYCERFRNAHIRLLHEMEGEKMAAHGRLQNEKSTFAGVCFVSEHFRSGSISANFLPVLEALDRAGLPLVLWSLTKDEDEVTGRIARLLGSRFRRERPSPCRVAVCLDGHTGTGAALAQLSDRLAPVQMDYLGYPYTTGCKFIDVKLGDSYADSAGAEVDYTETLVRLHPTMWAWRPHHELSVGVVLPACTGNRRLLVCQNFKKVRASFLDSCARILAEVPGSTIHFRCTLRSDCDSVFRSWILPHFSKTPDRAFLVPPASADRIIEDLATYTVALDTWPYSGTVTTMECLYAGLPVVTIQQLHHRGRTTSSLLRSSGLDELVTSCTDGFVRATVDLLTSDRQSLESLHERVASGFRSSAVMHPDTIARSLMHEIASRMQD